MNKIRFWLRFLWRLPIYARMQRLEGLAHERGLGHGNVMFDANNFITLPNDRIASSVFLRMIYEREGKNELRAFTELATGCNNLIDAGASGGYFSAIFAANHPGQHHILSVEMDPNSFAVLEDVHANNRRDNSDWKLVAKGLSNEKFSTQIVSSGYGAEVLTETSEREATSHAVRNSKEVQRLTVAFDTLDGVCRDNDFAPDIIKMDIESYEFEVITSSKELLAQHKPKLWIELHFAMMKERGVDGTALIQVLDDLGYVEKQTNKGVLAFLGSPLPDRVQLGLIAG